MSDASGLSPTADGDTPTARLLVQGATKRYGDQTVLDAVDLRIAPGAVFGLLGANGAGKSTLFRAILHLLPLDAGTIAVDGARVDQDPRAARSRIGYLAEEPDLDPWLTGWELLTLVARIKQLDNADERAALLDRFGLDDARHRPIGDYSLGMRKKIALIAALQGAPPLLLLDEPLNGLDAEAMRDLRRHLRQRADAGATIVVSSHVMAFVDRVCDAMAVLRDGRVVAAGDGATLRRMSGCAPDAALEDAFFTLAVDPPAAAAPQRG
ncbi:MAG: ABC transporter ATP-binding protein [Acidobacteriota bacterium]